MWAEAPVAIIDREVQPAVRALLEVLFLIDHGRFSLRAARRAPAAVRSRSRPSRGRVGRSWRGAVLSSPYRWQASLPAGGLLWAAACRHHAAALLCPGRAAVMGARARVRAIIRHSPDRPPLGRESPP